MARLTSLLSGKIGNVVFYQLNGKLCIRARPKRVKQSKATKKAADRFKKAVKISKTLRSALTEIVPDARKQPVMLRLNQPLVQWLNASEAKGFMNKMPQIEQFEFNEESFLTKKLKVPLNIEWKKQQPILLTFPATALFTAIKSPKGTVATILQILVTGCTVADAAPIGKYLTSIRITPRSIPPTAIELPYQLRSGCITIVVAALQYERIINQESVIVTDKRWLPAGIIGAYYGKPV